MKNKMLIAFALMVLVQLFVPAKMVWDSEGVIRDGKAFHFKTAPMDPNDPFRGKYVRLRFDATSYAGLSKDDWEFDETIFVHLGTDEAGFAKIVGVSKEAPEGDVDYVMAKTRNIWRLNDPGIRVEYPFTKFYMEEHKAPLAEKYYGNALRDSTSTVYGLVKVKNGQAVLEDVIVDGESLRDVEMKEIAK